MTISKRVMKAGTVALATVGLSTCNDNGAVDPAPPPLNCDLVAGGTSLVVGSATLVNGVLEVHLQNTEPEAHWENPPAVPEVVGGTFQSSMIVGGEAVIRIVVDAPAPASGTFLLAGALAGEFGDSCPVNRSFTFTITGSDVMVAERSGLPLGDRRQASIRLERREGHAVELTAGGASGGKATWSATKGVLVHAEGRTRWMLPKEPGLYQVELVVERESGLSIDTLTLEVT